MVRNRHKTKLNGADTSGVLPMSSKRAYAGNCRMIEIGSPGIPFRLTLNMDRVDTIRFEEIREEIKVSIPGSGKDAFTDRGGVEHSAVLPTIGTEIVSKGWTVIVVSNGQQNGINFPEMASAMACYNMILSMIRAVGIPTTFMGPLVPPEEEEEEESVDAADLHPDLAGGEGAGIAENDDDQCVSYPVIAHDENFELSDEDLALLENPVIDESEIEDAFSGPEDPPVEN